MRRDYTQIRLTASSLRRVGVELLELHSNELFGVDKVHLRCLTCGREWFPAIRSGRMTKGWWWCPLDAEHTKQKARLEIPKHYGLDYALKLHPVEVKLVFENGKNLLRCSRCSDTWTSEGNSGGHRLIKGKWFCPNNPEQSKAEAE